MSVFPTDTFRFPANNFRRPIAVARFIVPMVLGLALDLWVKNVAFDALAVAPPQQVARYDARHGTTVKVWSVNLRDQYAFPQNVEPRAPDSFAFGDALSRNDAKANEIITAMGGYAFIPGWVHFTVAVNEGAALGIGQGLRFMFILISIAAIGFLTYLFAHSGNNRFYQIVLGLLLAGVLGNMYDRIVYHYVRNMIRIFPQWSWVFPWVFNVADMLLCGGVGYMLLVFVLGKPRAPITPPTDEQDQKHLKVWT